MSEGYKCYINLSNYCYVLVFVVTDISNSGLIASKHFNFRLTSFFFLISQQPSSFLIAVGKSTSALCAPPLSPYAHTVEKFPCPCKIASKAFGVPVKEKSPAIFKAF